MSRGPLPAKNARRRNAPTIPTTSLPVTGRTGPIPRPPKWVALGPAGAAWWRWAWRTPQASGWSPGHEAYVAKRASLEDDLAVLDVVDCGSFEMLDLLGTEDARAFKALIGRLAGLATGRLAVIKVMMELDNRLGLNPKGMADLRWEVVNVEAPPAEDETDEVEQRRQDRRARLSAS